jgi:protein-tyrosine-phosphatase
MREVSIDIFRHTSDNVTAFLGHPIQFVITVCDNAREKCPIFPFAYKYLHWISRIRPPCLADRTNCRRDARDVLRARIETELMPLLPKVSKTTT